MGVSIFFVLLQGYGRVEWIAESDRVCVPLAVLGPLPSVRPRIVSGNPPPMQSPLALRQFCMLFQSTHEEIQGEKASAKPGERIAKSPLHCTITAQIMGC